MAVIDNRRSEHDKSNRNGRKSARDGKVGKDTKAGKDQEAEKDQAAGVSRNSSEHAGKADVYDQRLNRIIKKTVTDRSPRPDRETLEKSEKAIEEAHAAAKVLGVSPKPEPGFGDDDDEDEIRQRHQSFTLELFGVSNAVQAGQLEQCLNELPGVEAHVGYGKRCNAWVSAPETTTPTHIIEVLEASGVTAEKKVGSFYRQLSEVDSNPPITARKRRRRKRRQPGGGLWAKTRALRVARPENMEVLFTARELITTLRLVVALVLTIPVLAMSLFTQLQFPYWYWVSAALSLPVATYCAWPFHRAAIGGLRRGMAALDAATSLAIAIAYLWSMLVIIFMVDDPHWKSAPHWFIFQHEPQVFFDVAAGATTLVLIGRLLSRRNRLQGMRLVSSHDVDPGHMVTVFRKSGGELRKQQVSVAELHTGEDILVDPGDIIPVDGKVVGGSSLISPGPVSGHSHRAVVKVGEPIYAGGRNMGDTLKIRVERAGHTTRLAAMHRWVEACDRAEHQSTRTATRSASLLVSCAMMLAGVSFPTLWLLSSDASGSIAAGLATLTGAGPVAVAISTTLASRLGLARGISRGLLFKDEQAIWDLAECDLVLFNRVGTLTTGSMRVESVTAAEGENPDLVLRVAGALSMESGHGVSRALVRAARESRDQGSGGEAVPHWIEVTGEHVTPNGSFEAAIELPINGENKAVKASLWRPRDISELADERLALAAISGGTPLVVSWKNKNRGVITILDATKDDAAEAIEQLEDMGMETGMLSRDTYPVAKKAADNLGMSIVLAGIPPARKAATVRSMHRQGRAVALVGDPDLMDCLAVADVGILVGAADCLDKARASVVILRDEVRAIPDAVSLATKVRYVGKTNLAFSWTYNAIVLTASAVGLMNPLLSTFLMLGCSSIIESRTLRLRRA